MRIAILSRASRERVAAPSRTSTSISSACFFDTRGMLTRQTEARRLKVWWVRINRIASSAR
jgi:hypothetical protein